MTRGLLVLAVVDLPLALLQLRQALVAIERFGGERWPDRARPAASIAGSLSGGSNPSSRTSSAWARRAFELRTLAVGHAQHVAVKIEARTAHAERRAQQQIARGALLLPAQRSR